MTELPPSWPDTEAHRPLSVSQRIRVTIAGGAVLVLFGAILFLSAHAIATPSPGVPYYASERDLHEILWCGFAIALFLGGIIVMSVGLAAWCRP